MHTRIHRAALATVTLLALLIGGGLTAAPAQAATLEAGHIATVDLSGKCDWRMYITWSTTYSSVGSSTEPKILDTMQKACLLGQVQAKSIRVELGDVNQKSYGITNQDTVTPESTATWDTTNLNTAKFTNVRIADKPIVKITFYAGTRQTGTVLRYLAYQYR